MFTVGAWIVIGALFALLVCLVGYIVARAVLARVDKKIDDNYARVGAEWSTSDASYVAMMDRKIDTVNQNLSVLARSTQHIRSDNGKTIVDGTDLCINNTCLSSSALGREVVQVDAINGDIRDLQEFDQALETRYSSVDDSMTALLGRYTRFESRADALETKMNFVLSEMSAQ
ncbi:hypothetical protein FOA52_001765 [Chlamydomonas sp. UWO 241]|nr:hypothetical protein FOA52_001765 [Chlamydomonas sp. UWO 241]